MKIVIAPASAVLESLRLDAEFHACPVDSIDVEIERCHRTLARAHARLRMLVKQRRRALAEHRKVYGGVK